MTALCCPRCDGVLTIGTYENHEVHHCGACSGTLFSLPALGKTLERMSSDLFSKVSSDVPISELTDKGGVLQCPACSECMEHYGYMGSHKVMLDSCNQCNTVWVDALELAVMAQMRIRLDKNIEKFHAAHQPSDIVGLSMTIKAVEAAFLSGFVLG